MLKRFIWVLSLVLILGMALSACGAPAAAPAEEAPAAEEAAPPNRRRGRC